MQLSCRNTKTSPYWADFVMTRPILISMFSLLLFFVQLPLCGAGVEANGSVLIIFLRMLKK